MDGCGSKEMSGNLYALCLHALATTLFMHLLAIARYHRMVDVLTNLSSS